MLDDLGMAFDNSKGDNLNSGSDITYGMLFDAFPVSTDMATITAPPRAYNLSQRLNHSQAGQAMTLEHSSPAEHGFGMFPISVETCTRL